MYQSWRDIFGPARRLGVAWTFCEQYLIQHLSVWVDIQRPAYQEEIEPWKLRKS
jgi:hypothetical protein